MFQDARNAYLNASVTTATPATLVTMLCDRLVLDVERGLAAQELGDFNAAHLHLVHAQDVVAELTSSLRVDLWDGAAALQSLYAHLHGQLVQTNIHRDLDAGRHCLALATDLASTWRTAATGAGPAAAAAVG